MNLLIKGMEMPKGCRECEIEQHGHWCGLQDNYSDTILYDSERREDCPLVEIPDPKIIAAKMQLIKETKGYDEEIGHIKADYLMCELLTELGYEEAVKIFEEMEKWYA